MELLDKVHFPSKEEFLEGVKQYRDREKRDAMYKVATFLIGHYWGKPAGMADALSALLLTWNQAFYRFGMFDGDKLEAAIQKHFPLLDSFTNRDISSLNSDADDERIEFLFNDFLEALAIAPPAKAQGRRSPVAVAKALHLLAPNFFPLWDDKIAKAYGCYYLSCPALTYSTFSYQMALMSMKVREYVPSTDATILRLIDMYNYAKYTQGWI